MKVGKPRSKRVPVRLRHKIEKASAAKQRKRRKLAKKDPTWRSKLKKDPGIPNLFPYKDRILKEVEENRRRREDEEKQAKRAGLVSNQRDLDGSEDTQDDDEYMVSLDDDEDFEEDSDVLLDLGDEEEEENHGHNDAAMNEDAQSANPMAALLASARARVSEFENNREPEPEDGGDHVTYDDDESNDDSSFGGLSPPSSSAAHPQQHLSRASQSTATSKLISDSDVLLYVLDARDPPSTRSAVIERTVLADSSKRIILILNKIDLIPSRVLQEWLAHLRTSLPTLPLRSGSSAPSVKTFDHKSMTSESTANTIIKALKSYATRRSISGKLTVGVLGYPNVGKSSVINALTARLGGRASHARSRPGKDCPTGADAGVTTALREVKLDGSIKLIDSPGIVFPSLAAKGHGKGARKNGRHEVDEHARLVLLNAIPPQDIDDPVPAVSLLLHRLLAEPSRERFHGLLDVYGIPPIVSDQAVDEKDLTTDFLVQVARKRGRLGKGGVPNLHAAAQTVINDWRDGRIQGWVEAPRENGLQGQENSQTGDMAPSKPRQIVVKEWAEEFKLDGLWENATPAST